MKRLFLAWICSWLLGSTIWAQAPDVSWINISGSIKGSYQHKVLGADLSGFYVYESSGRERAIDKYSYNNNLIYSHKIPLDDRSIEIEELLVRREDVVVFFSIFNSNLRKHGLFYMVIPHQGEAGKPVILLDMDQVSNRTRSYFYITPNEDLSGFSAVHEHLHRPDETLLDINFYDALMRPLSSTKLMLPQADERYEIKNVQHDARHHLFVMFYTVSKSLKANDPEKGSYRLLKIDRFTLQADELRLGSSMYHLNAVQLGYDRQNNRFKMAGFYNEQAKGNISGVVLASINPDSMYFDTIGFSRFDAEFAAKLNSYKNSKKEKSLTDYFLGELIMRTDGGVVIMGESNYQTNQTFVQYSQGFPIYREVVYYHYDEVVLVSVNPDGSVDWRQIIPKTQTSVTPSPFFSYMPVAVGEHLHIIFNEEGRSKTNVVMYSVSTAGEVVPRSILSAEATDAMIIPADARIITPTTLLIPANKRKKKGIFRLTFEGI
ncbi:MAG: hypothetical protein ACK417_08220 [Bacteroidia bacterium]